MIIEKRLFLEGMNGDDSPRMLSDKASLNIMNARFGVSEYGRDYRLENTPGTTLVSQNVYPPYGTHRTIGSVLDIPRNRVIFFNWNSFGDHGIYCFDFNTRVTYAVLYDSQVIGGLNFSKEMKIARNAKLFGDLLTWVEDEQNEPKCINVEAGIKTNHASYVTDTLPYAWPMKYESTTLIKRPPIYRLEVTKVSDVSFSGNLTKNKAYQFTYRYHFKDRQISALSTYSALVPFNLPVNTFNSVAIKVSFSEYIDDDILQLDVCVKYGNTGKTYIIKQYTKNNAADAAAIIAHNAGTTQLGFSFYDNIAGTPLGDLERNIPFDNVPLYMKTLEGARDRLFGANYTSGYDTPNTTSLAVTLTNVSTGGSGSFAGTWGYITLHANYIDPGVQDTFNFPFVRRTSDSTVYYFPSVRSSTIWNGGLGTVPPSINQSLATFVAGTEAALVTYLKAFNYPYTGGGAAVGTPAWDAGYDIFYATLGAVTVSQFVPTQAVTQFFKSNSSYLVNISFFDRFRRKCGVIKNPVQVNIPVRSYSQTTFTTLLQWTLSSSNALSEIPDWAYYYQIHITKNQTTRFFVQTRVFDSTYVLKNSDNSYTYGNATFTNETYAVAFDLTTLTNYGQGYTFTEGDLVNVWTGSFAITVPVLGVDGNYILIAPVNLLSLGTTTDVLLEIYTPYIPQFNEPYFETGDVYPISNPGTSGRTYSVLVGQITGDTYAIERSDKDADLYIVEAMSPNDAVWKLWETDTGWANVIEDIGQQFTTNTIVFSDTFILGSKINGLNKFFDQKSVDAAIGPIQKLQLCSKTQEEGTIMLCIGQRQTASIYLGEVQIVGASLNNTLAVTSGVIGTVNVLKGMFGTINPESVLEYLGLVFWLDANNGAFIQYSINGLEPVSRYKQTRFFQRYSKEYVSSSTLNLDNINGFHHIPTGIDPFNKEMLCTLPALIYENYADNLPSYSSVPSYATSILNRFDIYDKLGKTMSYSFEKNNWGCNWQFMPEWYENIQTTMFGFKNGFMYIHNSDTVSWNKFYGTNYPIRICTTANLNPSLLRDLCNITVEGNAIPDFTVAYCDQPNVQITDLSSDDYEDLQGNKYATFLADRLSPNTTGTADEKLYNGDPLTDFSIKVMCEFQAYSSLSYIHFIDIGYNPSRGQMQPVNAINT